MKKWNAGLSKRPGREDRPAIEPGDSWINGENFPDMQAESQRQESFGFLLLLTEHFAGGKVKVLIELFIHQPDHLSHGERCQHRTDADSPDMSQEKKVSAAVVTTQMASKLILIFG